MSLTEDCFEMFPTGHHTQRKSKKRPARNSHEDIDELDRDREDHEEEDEVDTDGQSDDQPDDKPDDHGSGSMPSFIALDSSSKLSTPQDSNDHGSGSMPSFIALDSSSMLSTPQDSRTPTSAYGKWLSSRRVGWKVHRLTKKELCHSTETWHALNSTFPDTKCIVFFQINQYWISNSGLWKEVLETFQNGLENWRNESCFTRGAFHQAFCQCFSLTNLLSANQMQGFQ